MPIRITKSLPCGGIAINKAFAIVPGKVVVEFEDEASFDAAKLALLSKQGPLHEADMEAEKLFPTIRILPNVSEEDVKSAKLNLTDSQKAAFFTLLGMKVQISSYYVKQENGFSRGTKNDPICWQLRKDDFVKLAEAFSHLDMTKEQVALMVSLPAVRELMAPMQETKSDKGFTKKFEISQNKFIEVLEVISKHHLNEDQFGKLLNFSISNLDTLESAMHNLERYDYPEKPYSASFWECFGHTYEPKELVSQPSATQDE